MTHDDVWEFFVFLIQRQKRMPIGLTDDSIENEEVCE